MSDGDASPGRGSPGRGSLESPSKSPTRKSTRKSTARGSIEAGEDSPGRGSPRSPGKGGSPRGSPRGSPGRGSPGKGHHHHKGADGSKQYKNKDWCCKCKCCMWVCPCFYCCHPETTIDPETLLKQMEEASGGKKKKRNEVNVNLVELQLEMEREKFKAHKAKWQRRWIICCLGTIGILGSAIGILVTVMATGAWSIITEDAGFPLRLRFGAVYLGSGKLIVTGGTNSNQNFGDVWESGDYGATWRMLVEATPWSPRHGHGFVYSKNTGNIFVLGGDVAGIVGSPLRLVVSDVWRSRDAGATWELRAGRAPWPPRKLFGSFANNAGQLFVIGGDSGVPRSSGLNDVWRSDDEGRSWTAINLMSPWSARSSFAAIYIPGGTAANRMYIMGGTDGWPQHDVWYSDDDGKTWFIMPFAHVRDKTYTVEETRASWTPRYDMATAVYPDGKVLVLGGRLPGKGEKSFTSEVWSLLPPKENVTKWWEKKLNDDTINNLPRPLSWELDVMSPGWSPRVGHQAFVDEEGFAYIIGGQDFISLRADVWISESSVDITNLQSVYDRTTAQATTSVDVVDQQRAAAEAEADEDAEAEEGAEDEESESDEEPNGS